MSMNENARDEECVSEDLLPIAIKFCGSEDFLNEISDFKLNHAIVFDNVSEMKDNDGEEFPHEYHAVFIQYQQLVDDAFERLADEQGFTTKSLYRCFTDAGKFASNYDLNF